MAKLFGGASGSDYEKGWDKRGPEPKPAPDFDSPYLQRKRKRAAQLEADKRRPWSSGTPMSVYRPSSTSAPAKVADDMDSVRVTARKRARPVDDIPAPKAATPKLATPAKRSEVVMGTAPVNKSERPDTVKKVPQATPTVSKPSAAPKPRNYSKEAMDILGGSDKGALDEDNAVMKRLRERAAMSQKERDKPLSSTNVYANKLKGLGFAKGGHVKANGCARKGKTRGRLI